MTCSICKRIDSQRNELYLIFEAKKVKSIDLVSDQINTFGKVTVLGGGSFGTILGNLLAEKGCDVCLWMRNKERVNEINTQHTNRLYLPGISLSDQLKASDQLELSTSCADVIIICVPSASVRTLCDQLKPVVASHQILLSTTKGIEAESFLLMSEVIKSYFPLNPLAVLSGPNLAKEIAQKQPAATVVASKDKPVRDQVQRLLNCSYFRVYVNSDRYGVELGGALKNIYAIVSGMADAMGFGENTKSMLITRSLAEMSRFAVAMGANPLTFLGLSGVGDLVATCTSNLSRNYRVGYALAKGSTLDNAVEALGEVAEGVNTLRIVRERAIRDDIYMPLVDGLYQVIFREKSPMAIAEAMMSGEPSSDVEFILPKPAQF